MYGRHLSARLVSFYPLHLLYYHLFSACCAGFLCIQRHRITHLQNINGNGPIPIAHQHKEKPQLIASRRFAMPDMPDTALLANYVGQR